MARPPTKSEAEIIEAGLAIEAEVIAPVRPTAIRDRVGGGNSNRIRQVWQDFVEARAREAAEPIAADELLPNPIFQMLEAEQAEQAEKVTGRYITLYKAAEKILTERFSIERSALEGNLAAMRDELDAAY